MQKLSINRYLFLLSLALIPISTGCLIICCKIAEAQNVKSGTLAKPPTTPKILPAQNLRGWDYLYRLLTTSYHANPQTLSQVLADSRMPKREELFFNIPPRESHHLYRKHNTPKARSHALKFYRASYSAFRKSWALYGIPDEIILAILQIETQCGDYTGRERVFFRLARLASANEDANVKANYLRYLKSKKKISITSVRERAQWLEREFAPHASATLNVAKQMGIHPLELRGSGAGAIGLPQFLPGNIERYGVDGNGDRKVDLFSSADAIPSVASFLTNHGWQKDKPMTIAQRKQVLFSYNRSDNYVATVVAMAEALRGELNKIQQERRQAEQH